MTLHPPRNQSLQDSRGGPDISVAVTGAGGPAAQDGHEPGTVFLAVDGGREQVLRLDLPGEPATVCAAAALAALDALVSTLDQ
jgi:nicotinamide-nucleotide amidase